MARTEALTAFMSVTTLDRSLYCFLMSLPRGRRQQAAYIFPLRLQANTATASEAKLEASLPIPGSPKPSRLQYRHGFPLKSFPSIIQDTGYISYPMRANESQLSRRNSAISASSSHLIFLDQQSLVSFINVKIMHVHEYAHHYDTELLQLFYYLTSRT